jgi:hypothetical protein
MRLAPIKSHIIGLGALAVMAAWVPSAFAATAEERAKCEEMEKQMGTEQRHEHSQDKGQGPSAMNMTHARCKEILAEPTPKKGSGHDHK